MAITHEHIIDELVSVVEHEDASDLHLCEGRVPFTRIAGLLVPLVKFSTLTKADIESVLDQLLTPDKKEHFLREKEVDFSYTQHSLRFRGNAFLQQGLIAVALRLIPKNIRSLTDLHLPPILETFTKRNQGFFLVVGPVGQGKSTTLAAMIDMINQDRAEHILTIEDPIEYQYEMKKSIVNQREVGLDTNDFHTALVSMVREDINVVLVGEMRNPETMSAAVTAAETGHLVFSTLHTNDATQTIDRIIDSFPSDQQPQIRTQLAGSLAGIFSQRLIPRISGGVIPAYELLINNIAVSNLIRERRSHEIPSVIETSSQLGMIDFNRCLADLVRGGEISLDNAYHYSLNPKVLDKLL
jgi:twitching motility protein PilT